MIWRLVILALVAGAGAAGWEARSLRERPLPLPPGPRVEAPGKEEAPQFAQLRRAELGLYPNLVQRPPFSPDRRPRGEDEAPPPDAAVEPAAQSAAPPAAPAARLLGVFVDGADRVAVLADTGSSDVTFVRRGGLVDGWQVENVGDSGVTLKKGASEVEILLFQAKD